MGSDRGDRPRVVILIGIVPLYVGFAALGHELGDFGTLSVWYPPAGLALAAGVLLGWRSLPGVAVGEFIGGIVVFGIASDFTVPQMVVNALGYAAIYIAFGRIVARLWAPERPNHVGAAATVLGLCAVAPIAAAMYGMAMQLWAGLATVTDYWSSVSVWATGDALGTFTLMPALLVFGGLFGLGRWRGRPPGLRTARPAVTTATILLPTVVAMALFVLARGTTYFLYLVLVPVAIVAVRHGVAGVALASPLLSPVMTAFGDRAVGAILLDRIDLQVLLLECMAVGYVLGVAIDDRASARVRLERSQRHLEEAQAVARMGSFSLADHHMSWSQSMYAVLGVEPDAAVDLTTYLAQVDDTERSRVDAEIRRSLATGEPFDHEFRTSGGGDRWLHARGEPVLGADGQVVALTGYLQDVTERHAVAQALRDAAEREAAASVREREAADRLREADATKDALLLAVSHEVRTPLTIVRGVAATLLRRELDSASEEMGRLMASLDRGAERLEYLLTDLLDVSRLAAGEVRALRQDTDVEQVVRAAVARAWTRSEPVTIDCANVVASADPGLLERIIANLIANADRYAGDAGPVRVWARREGQSLHLAVEDAGPGVEQAERLMIFERFAQARRISHSPGTGIGLYLVARFARLHDGEAWVDESPSGGAAFHVVLRGEPRGAELPSAATSGSRLGSEG